MARIFSTQYTDTINTNSGGPTDTSNFTMSLMYYPIENQVTNSEYLLYIGYGVGSGSGYGLYVHHNNQIELDIAFVANYASGLNLVPRQWNGIALTRTGGGTWQIWVNGVKSSTTASNNPFNPDGKYTISGRPDSGGTRTNFATGAFAEVAFWSGEVLPDQMLKALTTGSLTPLSLKRSTLAQYHPLKDTFGAGTTEPFVLKGTTLTRTGTKPFPHPNKKSPFTFAYPAVAAAGRLFRTSPLWGLGGAGQTLFNPPLTGI
jgi:Concanavalin A-like lectin/glucanases superfamily